MHFYLLRTLRSSAGVRVACLRAKASTYAFLPTTHLKQLELTMQLLAAFPPCARRRPAAYPPSRRAERRAHAIRTRGARTEPLDWG